ncbi:MAG: phenylalanine--tRNA ligase subunit beta, partial [Psychroflexus sp.]|nr:phenylalanine--tRNA ligase subunit beta [Psychroflexus sp.]
DLNVEEASVILTDLGLEVEGITDFESIKGGLKGILVGHVESCEQHPNADRLKLTQVNIGEETVQIVCGAPNIAAGQNVPVATVGTKLFNTDEPWEVKKGKLRGEVSLGMICSESEIGISDQADGIMVLDEKHEAGTALSELYNLENDKVIEIGLTPNRADAMSHWGVARDLRAGLLQQSKNNAIVTPSVSNFHVENRSKKISVSVEKPELAPRYCSLTISNVTVKSSPDWLQNRLKAIGIKPMNNIVDATNYVMHELGQPLHAFNADFIKDQKIIVKTVEKGTKFTTLDKVERELHQEDLMICDAEKPLCIAGVFGGLNSGIKENTTSIFLESAYFDAVSIRKTAKRHGLNTDASFRYERGIDPDITKYALRRAALLIEKISGGKVSSDADDFYPNKIQDFQVFLSFEKINHLVGEEINTDKIKSILSSLDIKVKNVTESGLGLIIPAYRVDVQREVDVIEEILRVYGYNTIGIDSKFNVSVSKSSKFDDHKVQNRIANQLVSQGFYETMANSLTKKKHTDLTEKLNSDHDVEMLNPLSHDLSVMRQSMLFSGLESLAYNINRNNQDLKFFEFGKTYHKYEEDFVENKHLSLFITGKRTSNSWLNTEKDADFFYLKGILTALFTSLGLTGIKFADKESDTISEGLSIKFKKKKLVEFGRVNTHILSELDIDQTVLYADIDWDLVLELIKNISFKGEPISKFPSTQRDFALLVDAHIQFKDIEDIALKTDKKLLKNVDLFDVYTGDKLPEGKKSYAVSFKFRDEHKTLTDKQVDKIMNKLQKQFEEKLNASLR